LGRGENAGNPDRMEVLEDLIKCLGKRKRAQNGAKTDKCLTKCFTMFYQNAKMVKHLVKHPRKIVNKITSKLQEL
jgi:hypothetical protein